MTQFYLRTCGKRLSTAGLVVDGGACRELYEDAYAFSDTGIVSLLGSSGWHADDECGRPCGVPMAASLARPTHASAAISLLTDLLVSVMKSSSDFRQLARKYVREPLLDWPDRVRIFFDDASRHQYHTFPWYFG